MTSERDIGRVLEHWFTERPTEVADRVLDSVADRIGRQPQRPAWRLRWRHTQRNDSIRWIAAAAAVLLIAAAGFAVLGGTSTPGVAGPPASSSPTPAPSSSVSVGVPEACDLMTPDEAAGALHVTALVTTRRLINVTNPQATAGPGAPAYACDFDSGDRSLFALTYYKEDGAFAFANWKTSTGLQAVSGLGDEALWNPVQTTLYILKEGRAVAILPVEGPTPTMTLEAAKAIGAILVKRM
jgi:hypothetical protein